MIHSGYIIEVLGRFEGKALRKGYVPCDKQGVPLGASGVTVGTGFDLGQQTAADLRALGLPESLRAKLEKYLGLKKEAALALVDRQPLNLDQAEVEKLDKAVHEKYINETAGLFGRAAFDQAPKQAQAVAVSLHYQFGTPQRDASPSLGMAWNAMRAERYKDAAQYLTAPQGWSISHRQYLPRRKAEAALLLEIV
jgi:hypothetical protein